MSTSTDERWWKVGLASIAPFWIAVSSFQKFSRHEQTGEGFSTLRHIAWLYDLGGKWLPTGFYLALAALFLFIAWNDWKNSR